VVIMLIAGQADGRRCSFVRCAIMQKICWIFLCGIMLFWESGGVNAVVLSVVVILHVLVSGEIGGRLVRMFVVVIRYLVVITVGLSLLVLDLVRFVCLWKLCVS